MAYRFNRVIKDDNDYTLRRRVVNVEFADGETLTTKEMQFKIGEEDAVVKRAFKQYLDELNTPAPSPITDVDYTEPTPEEPDPAELEKQAWQQDWAKLQEVEKLIASGVLTGNEAPVTALRNKVRTGFKPAYL